MIEAKTSPLIDRTEGGQGCGMRVGEAHNPTNAAIFQFVVSLVVSGLALSLADL